MTPDQTRSFQHYVPRFLLQYFTDDGKLHVYDRERNEFRSQSSNRTAGEKSYYVFTDKKGEKHDELEKMFSAIEGTASSIIKNLVEGKEKPSMQDKVELAMFIAALYLRVPESLKRSEDMATQMTKEIMSRSARMDQHFNDVMDKIEKKLGKKATPEMRKNIQNSFVQKDYRMKFPKGYMLKTMMLNLEEIYKIMVQMEWLIIKAPEGKAFISSDHPAFTFNIKPEGFWGSGIGLIALNCETSVILTPKLAIYLNQKRKPKSIKFITANSELIDSLNFRTALLSSRFVISHSDTLLRKWIGKTRLNERGPYSSVRVG